MPNNNDAVKEAAKEISEKANRQIMSHTVMALKQYIESKLIKGDDINSTFEKRIKALYGADAIKPDNISYKTYITDNLIKQENDDFKNYARIYSKIDKVLSVKDDSISYALHLRITSNGKGKSSYDDEGFVSEDCGRFAVGHDIGHAFLNLGDLIRRATTGDNQSVHEIDDYTERCYEYEYDFFSYILSDLRDFYLLELSGTFDLDKAFESYKNKANYKFLESVIDEIIPEMFDINDISLDNDEILLDNDEMPFDIDEFSNKVEEKTEKKFNEIKNIFKKSKKLYDDSLQYTMSHPIIALNEIIKSKFQKDKLKELREKLKKLEDKLKELKEKLKEYDSEEKSIKLTGDHASNIKKMLSKRKIRREMDDLNKEMDDLINEIDDLEIEKPGINIHLISKEEHSGELIIDCYNRRDENSKKNFYCFEIIIKKFSSKEKNDICKKTCKAIGFIYFYYNHIIDRFDGDNELGHLQISNIQEYISKFACGENTIDDINNFAEELYSLRNINFKNKRADIKKETNLQNRLASYAV